MDNVARNSLEPIHAELREMIAAVDGAITSADLDYFLAYGTALGALRHDDFIPWDFDADLYLLGNQYEAALDALSEAFKGTRFELLRPGPDSDYEYLFARVAIRGVHHTVLRVDLFALDSAPESRYLRRALTSSQRLLNKIYMLKLMPLDTRGHYGWKQRLLARIAKVLLRPIPRHSISELHATLRKKLNSNCKGASVVNLCGSYGDREYYPATWFDGSTSAHLGPLPVRLCAEPEKYLSLVYGDYTTLPPDADIQNQLNFARTFYVQPLQALKTD